MALSILLLNAKDTTKLQNLQKRVQILEQILDAQKKEKLQKALNGGDSFSQKSFIPDISLIISGSAVFRNISNENYEGYGIDGFVDQTDEIPFNKNKGFNLNYAELGMHSDVGPYFVSDAIFHLSPEEFEIEEAYITTKKLPANLDMKMGKFKSGFGRINSIHPHAQHFTTQPLIYEAMLGVEGINDAGIALHWVAPTDTYLLGGFEAMQGENELSFGNSEHNLYIGYIKSGFDVGDSTSLLMGASIASSKTTSNNNSILYGGDITLKYIIDSYSSINLQGEYLSRDKDTITQAGYYAQLLYQQNSNWEFGVRYDAINKNAKNKPDDLDKYSAIVAYKPFEFSKIRFQLTQDRAMSFDGQRQTTNQAMIEFVVETGAHGSHAF